MTAATSGTGNAPVTTETFEAPVIQLPKFGEWPYFPAPTWLRNGREAGAWAVGIVTCIPEKCAHVWVPEEFVAGTTHAMIEGNLIVKGYSYDGDQGTTLEVRCAYYDFVEDAR